MNLGVINVILLPRGIFSYMFQNLIKSPSVKLSLPLPSSKPSPRAPLSLLVILTWKVESSAFFSQPRHKSGHYLCLGWEKNADDSTQNLAYLSILFIFSCSLLSTGSLHLTSTMLPKLPNCFAHKDAWICQLSFHCFQIFLHQREGKWLSHLSGI